MWSTANENETGQSTQNRRSVSKGFTATTELTVLLSQKQRMSAKRRPRGFGGDPCACRTFGEEHDHQGRSVLESAQVFLSLMAVLELKRRIEQCQNAVCGFIFKRQKMSWRLCIFDGREQPAHQHRNFEEIDGSIGLPV